MAVKAKGELDSTPRGRVKESDETTAVVGQSNCHSEYRISKTNTQQELEITSPKGPSASIPNGRKRQPTEEKRVRNPPAMVTAKPTRAAHPMFGKNLREK
jgi:hypothetical protein